MRHEAHSASCQSASLRGVGSGHPDRSVYPSWPQARRSRALHGVVSRGGAVVPVPPNTNGNWRVVPERIPPGRGQWTS